MAAIKAIPRDGRIDFVRGVALLIIFVDHIPGNPCSIITPITLCFFDMSEVFVCVSGYVGGMVYHRVLSNKGFWVGQAKALKRTSQIYLAHVGSLLVHLILLAALVRVVPWDDAPPFQSYWAFQRAPVSFLESVFCLQRGIAIFDILPIYIAMLPLLPLALWAYSHRPVLAIATSLGSYLGAYFFQTDHYWMENWAWGNHPFSWQILFLGSAFISRWDARKLRTFVTSKPLDLKQANV